MIRLPFRSRVTRKKLSHAHPLLIGPPFCDLQPGLHRRKPRRIDSRPPFAAKKSGQFVGIALIGLLNLLDRRA